MVSRFLSYRFLTRVMNEIQTEMINNTNQVFICLSVKAFNQILHLISVCEGNVTMLLLLLLFIS